jgi:hypothetical protein
MASEVDIGIEDIDMIAYIVFDYLGNIDVAFLSYASKMTHRNSCISNTFFANIFRTLDNCS